MKNKSIIAGGIAAVVVVLIVVVIALTNRSDQMSGDPKTYDQSGSVSGAADDGTLVDKTPLKESSGKVAEKIRYCKKALDKTKGDAMKQKGFKKLWKGVNEIYVRAYAQAMTQTQMDELETKLQKFVPDVDKLYEQNSKVIEKIKKKEAKEEKKKAKKKAAKAKKAEKQKAKKQKKAAKTKK